MGSRTYAPSSDGGAPGRGLGAEADGASQRGAAGERRRYFLASAARAERDRRVRRVRLGRAGRPAPHAPGSAAGPPPGPAAAGGRPGKLALPTPAFLPLAADAGAPEGRQREGVDRGGAGGVATAEDLGAAGAGESHEMYLLRRTRELNAAVRAAPYQLQLWLDFAAFQDEAAQCARCARRARPRPGWRPAGGRAQCRALRRLRPDRRLSTRASRHPCARRGECGAARSSHVVPLRRRKAHHPPPPLPACCGGAQASVRPAAAGRGGRRGREEGGDPGAGAGAPPGLRRAAARAAGRGGGRGAG